MTARIRALHVLLAGQPVGVLFRLDSPGHPALVRFVPDMDYARTSSNRRIFSLGLWSPEEDAHFALWSNPMRPEFNGAIGTDGSTTLPPFFQNLLPEGVFRDHVAELRGCSSNDHFELLAACGGDLPGAMQVLPVHLSDAELAHLPYATDVLLKQEVVQAPVEQAVSLSGIQPKLGAVFSGGRYVARTRKTDAHVIAKLPVVTYARLPEAEYLGLNLAAAAGLDVCQAQLVSVSKLDRQQAYAELDALGEHVRFLAVHRFDRDAKGLASGRVHCEDFAQVLGVMPAHKYGASYLSVARVLMSHRSLGANAVCELMARLFVNELMGNPDMHLKNIGLMYPGDGLTPHLSPAYDLVPYALYNGARGHALHLLDDAPQAVLNSWKGRKPLLTVEVVKHYARVLEIPERTLLVRLKKTLTLARQRWPELIANSMLLSEQKDRLRRYLNAHPLLNA